MKFKAKFTTLNIINNNPIEREEIWEGKNEQDIIRKVKTINYVVDGVVVTQV